MQDAGKYDWAFGLGFMYSYVLTVPHSVAINLAFPTEIAHQGMHPCNRKEKTTSFGVNLLRSQVLYRAAHHTFNTFP